MPPDPADVHLIDELYEKIFTLKDTQRVLVDELAEQTYRRYIAERLAEEQCLLRLHTEALMARRARQRRDALTV
jgi:hypothetical protein